MLLLDSHTFLWAVLENPRLGALARAAITANASVYVSAATIWELEIKAASGKLKIPPKLTSLAVSEGFHPLNVTAEHAEGIRAFPELAKHDPFDRLLVAQAHSAGLKLLTADRVLLALDRDFILDATR